MSARVYAAALSLLIAIFPLSGRAEAPVVSAPDAIAILDQEPITAPEVEVGVDPSTGAPRSTLPRLREIKYLFDCVSTKRETREDGTVQESITRQHDEGVLSDKPVKMEAESFLSVEPRRVTITSSCVFEFGSGQPVYSPGDLYVPGPGRVSGGGHTDVFWSDDRGRRAGIGAIGGGRQTKIPAIGTLRIVQTHDVEEGQPSQRDYFFASCFGIAASRAGLTEWPSAWCEHRTPNRQSQRPAEEHPTGPISQLSSGVSVAPAVTSLARTVDGVADAVRAKVDELVGDDVPAVPSADPVLTGGLTLPQPGRLPMLPA